MKNSKFLLALLLAIIMLFSAGCMPMELETQTQSDTPPMSLVEDGSYTSMQDVADYIHTYGKLPSNFITKRQAQDLGWISNDGNLDEVAPGKSIGGDSFGNREGLLPKQQGRKYYECDINYKEGFRGAERIIYSNDGLVFYTSDHYQTFDQLY